MKKYLDSELFLKLKMSQKECEDTIDRIFRFFKTGLEKWDAKQVNHNFLYISGDTITENIFIILSI